MNSPSRRARRPPRVWRGDTPGGDPVAFVFHHTLLDWLNGPLPEGRGKPLTLGVAEPLRESKIFPPLVCQMVAVGETTGGLDTMLRKVAELYEDEVDDAVANLTALMEPMIMVVLGVILGGLVISMYLPIFQMGSLV